MKLNHSKLVKGNSQKFQTKSQQYIIIYNVSLVVTCLTVAEEIPGSNLIMGICIYHDSHSDIQTLAWAVQPYSSACLGQLSLLPLSMGW